MKLSLPLSLFKPFSEKEVRKLPGGLKRGGGEYFVAIINGETITKVFLGKLRNQLQSVTSNSSYPAGYEPFVIVGKEWNFDIATSKFEDRKLSIKEGVRPLRVRIVRQSRPAVILSNPPAGSERAKLLLAAAKETEFEIRVRRAAEKSVEYVEVVADLLREAVLQCPAKDLTGAVQTNLADRFEFYLQRASAQTLGDCLKLLQFETETPAIRHAAQSELPSNALHRAGSSPADNLQPHVIALAY